MSLFSINNSKNEKIKNITAENLTQEQIEKYFYAEKNGEIIFHIPDELNTEEIRNKVFNLNVRNIMYLNEFDITENMLIEAVKKSDEISSIGDGTESILRIDTSSNTLFNTKNMQ